MTFAAFSAYPLVKLGTVASIQPGYPFESERFTNETEDIPLVKGENVQQGFIDWAAAKHWPAAQSDHLDSYVLEPGDVVVAMDRPWVQAGLKWAYIQHEDPRALLVQRVARLKAKKGIDQTYLRCLISSAYFAAYVQPIVTGVNVPHISGKQIGDLKIPLPTLQQQRKIAAMLSAYDDLIANNQRRIALLESMAEEIYREWFVRLRFPSELKAGIKNGVPIGWKRGQLSDIAFEASKATKPGPQLHDRFYCPLDAMATKRMLPDNHYPWEEAQSSLVTFEKGAFLFGAMRPYQHKVVIAPFAGITRSTCFVVEPRQPEFYSYLFLTLFEPSSVEFATLICNGSDRPYSVWRGGFERLPVLIPECGVLERFEKVVRPIFDSLTAFYFQQRALAAQRDALLPRLISGKLRVDHLDICFPPSMQDAA